MDNLRTGSLENFAHLQRDVDFGYVHHDVTTYRDCPGRLDEVYHFAFPASPADFERIPIEILWVGSSDTHNCLDLARAKGVHMMLAMHPISAVVRPASNY